MPMLKRIPIGKIEKVVPIGDEMIEVPMGEAVITAKTVPR